MWRQLTIEQVMLRRQCLLQSFRSLCCRARAIGMPVALNGVCILSHMALRRAEILHALEKQQLPDIDFSTEDLVST
jgi:hypothetical protein